MVNAILHVKDDDDLRGLVELAYQGFGFRGNMVTAGSVTEALERLDAALGANAYLNKSPHGRTLTEVIKSLYNHWGKDAVLPREQPIDPVQQVIMGAIALRRRHALLYQRLADLFGDSRSESAFWLSRALVESNLVNLFEFLRRQVDERVLPESLLGELAPMQTDTARVLSAAEHAVEQNSITRVEAYRYLLDLVSALNIEAVSRLISHLFPVVPQATKALRDMFVTTVEDITTWIDIHTTDPRLHQRAVELRDGAAPSLGKLAESVAH